MLGLRFRYNYGQPVLKTNAYTRISYANPILKSLAKHINY
jgi:hypothetical protein